MIRGIRFEYRKKESDGILRQIFKPIDLTVFDWQIGFCEIYKMHNLKLLENPFSELDRLTGNQLNQLIKENSFYVIFAELFAYPKGCEFSEIKTYEDFIASSCELVLLVVDSIYVDVYCKNQDWIESLFRNAIEYQFNNIEYVTDENDSRTRLSV